MYIYCVSKSCLLILYFDKATAHCCEFNYKSIIYGLGVAIVLALLLHVHMSVYALIYFEGKGCTDVDFKLEWLNLLAL